MGSVAKESNDDWDISALSELVNKVLNAVSRNVTQTQRGCVSMIDCIISKLILYKLCL